ncbi:MAG TPA: NAD(P)H-dependent glycerol-3-phosphate dehydrogenase [Planctomycetota bacterium]|nr:NAD(P)H-dependent glycerol-3-phosphate dehydrogenase [Planctomycetota bacterium]
MNRIVTVIGCGGFGTAIALVLRENGHEVRMWGHDKENVARMQRDHVNQRYLDDVPIPEDVLITTEPQEAVEHSRLVVSAVPTRHLRSVMESFRDQLSGRVPIISVTKGIEPETLLRPSQILEEFFPNHTISILSGPSHAEEVARRIPSSVVVADESRERAKRLQKFLNTSRFRVYANTDPVGVELAGALKNVIAIAAGICDGLGFGDNTKSALVTRGLVEIVRLATRLGAKKETFAGLAGVGDLITTSFSRHGRNRWVGQRLGEGIPIEQVLRETTKVAEGVETSRACLTLARRHRVEMPIAREVYEILFEGKNPREALESLMSRSSKTESW